MQTIGTRKLVIGYDHHFGKNREGSFEQLKLNGPRYGFQVEEIPRQDVDHIGVSSTRIRQALEQGDIATATHFLGTPIFANRTRRDGRQDSEECWDTQRPTSK